MSPPPDWLIGLVTDVEAPPLELDDVSFLEGLQTGIPQHLLFHLRQWTEDSVPDDHSRVCCGWNWGAHGTDLAVFVDVVFEVIIFGDDSFGDERQVCDADSGHRGGAVCLSQPCDLSCLLVVRVLQVQTCVHGQNPPVSASERTGRDVYLRLLQTGELISGIPVYLGDDEVSPVDEGDHLPLRKGLSIRSLDQNSRSVPNLLHAHISVLYRHKTASCTHSTDVLS